MAPNTQHWRTLNSGWRIHAADLLGSTGEDVSLPGFDTMGWVPASVPSTVLATLVGEGRYEAPYVGMNLQRIPTVPFERPWWYRTVFALSDRDVAGTVLLGFDGINYAADIWVNGRQIAAASDVRGAFRRFQFDISQAVAEGDNVVAVEVVPPKPGDFSTGFVDWNPAPPDRNMGLFRPVTLRLCGGVSIENPFVESRLDLQTLAKADLTVSADLTNHLSRPVAGVLEGRIEEMRFSQTVSLKPGEKRRAVFAAEEDRELSVRDPRIWWPHQYGTAELYCLDLRFVVDGENADVRSIRFGIRDVSDYWTPEGHRGFRVNGRDVLIKGAGWTDDLLLADTPERIEAQLQYVRHMNLNCIRCEGIWGTDQTLYDLCDEYGILAMVGWSCHWEHEQYLGKPVDERYGGVVAPEDIELVGRSWEDQLLWLRHHPSIFVWAVASDKVPAPELEGRYIETFRRHDPSRPYLASTGGFGSDQHIIGSEEIVSDVSGGSGVKMLGPYDYTPPVYWYTDTRRGGAYGFNTETSPGAVVPTPESLTRMIPPDHLWPIDRYWDWHCGLNEFDTLVRYREAMRRRYGEPESFDEFSRKAQVLNYELMRPMFEAFRANKCRATGIIHWMLNAAWPKMYWQLYDWYLVPTAAFYAVRKACVSPQLIYHYGQNSIYLVHDGLADVTGLGAEIRLYDIRSRVFLDVHLSVDASCERAERIFTLPQVQHRGTTYFLDLRLTNARGVEVATNFYWLSTQPDVLDDDARVEPWAFYTPSREYADLTMLNCLPGTQIDLRCDTRKDDRENRITVELANRGEAIAFFVELLLTDSAGEPIVPILWQDNYMVLLPGQRKTIEATCLTRAPSPVLKLRGWNIEERRYVL